MNDRRVFPLGWYLHVAASTALKWVFVNGVARALLQQISHVESSRELDPRDLVAAVA